MTRVGVSVHDSFLIADPQRRRGLLDLAADSGLDHVGVGDHVSFHGGTGFDGMVSATAVLTTHDTLPVVVGIYLLGLRHPLLAARQMASISQLAPGRLVLGIGVGGEDRSEVSNSGVEPETRGRRLDEALEVIQALAEGEAVDFKGEFFTLESARILPPPSPRIPLVIGGKGEVAIRRTARFGDGWLGIFCSARRFEQTRLEILQATKELARPEPSWFGINVWCGLDADAAKARELVAHQMETLYHLPFDKFEHLAPAGPPAQVAEWLAPFVAAGAENITLVPAASSPEAGIAHVAEVRALLLAG